MVDDSTPRTAVGTTGPRPCWPDGRPFAFTVFDDTDWTTLGNGAAIYDLLTDLGLHVTKSVWMRDPGPSRTTGGGTCEDPAYLDWVLQLQARGHEMGFHNASDRSSTRAETVEALDRFEREFGHAPRVGADHAGNREALCAGADRVSGVRRTLYRAVGKVRQPHRPRFSGGDPATPYYWADVAARRVRYWRRFTWATTDLSRTGPVLYADRQRPGMPSWFDAAHAPRLEPLLARVAPDRLEQLARRGGVCILYTHFGVDFVDDRGRPDARLVAALTRLAGMGGWYAPVGDVLDHLQAERGVPVLGGVELARHEWRWIADRVRNRGRLGPRVVTHEVQP